MVEGGEEEGGREKKWLKEWRGRHEKELKENREKNPDLMIINKSK